MEDEDHLQELEERLYSKFYHDESTIIEESLPSNSFSNTSTERYQYLTKMRYWQNSKKSALKNIQNSKQKFRNKQQIKKDQIISAPKTDETGNDTLSFSKSKSFVPYSSVLSFMSMSTDNSEESNSKQAERDKPKNYEKKKSKPSTFPKEMGKFINPMSKPIMKKKYEEKKVKAEEVRKKSRSQNKKTVFIELESSSDDESVIHIETPAPPLITLDDSSDEEKVNRLKRGHSPSTSSMISDDFIVAGDKRRLIHPFSNSDQLLNTTENVDDILKNSMKKVQSLVKFSASSSNSNSARSSCERNVSNQGSSSSNGSKIVNLNKKRENNGSNENDSIYETKAKCVMKKTKRIEKSSSDEDQLCITAKGQPIKSVRNKSIDEESEHEEDPVSKLISSTPLAPKKKRSRFITPNYNESEFASLISTVLEAQSDDDNTTADKIETNEDHLHADKTSEEATDEIHTQNSECIIVEEPIEVYEINDNDDDDDDSEIKSDISEDSIKQLSSPVECNLSLNVIQTIHSPPHEFSANLTDYGTTSNENLGKLDCEVGWNAEMKYFYNECTYGRDFCTTTIKNSMPSDPKLWRVNNTDRVRISCDRRIKCHNCNEWGHKAAMCKRPKKRIVCLMCSEIGHRETRCPNSICLRCGKPNNVFTTMCSSCSKLSKKICPLCHYKGHDLDTCPDKWRRYFSTTDPECNELNITFKKNDRVYCSICARQGHFAENCSHYSKTIQGMITSSRFIVSNKPSYPKNHSFELTPRRNVHVLQLITYMENYTFNFKFPSNCQMYPKFKAMFLRHQYELQKRNAIGNTSHNTKDNERKDRSRKRGIDNNVSNTSIVKSTDKNETVTSHDDSNSNYSFSDYYKSHNESDYIEFSGRNRHQLQSTSVNISAINDTLPEFISLGSDQNAIENINIKDCKQICDAKLILSKEHATVLMSRKGQDFLYDLGNHFDIITQFKWDAKGNSLLMTGLSSNQLSFRCEVREFIYRHEVTEYEKQIEISTQIPKVTFRIASLLKSNLQSIKNFSIKETKQTLDKFIAAENTLDHKKTIKYRKMLNVAFIGYAELNNGSFHLNELRKILSELEKDIQQGNGNIGTNENLRNEISTHFKYIFSAINHGDYKKMFVEFKKVIQQRQNRRNQINSTYR